MISDLAIRYRSSANQNRVVRFPLLAFIFVCVFVPHYFGRVTNRGFAQTTVHFADGDQ